jgi:hypothetical protein
MRSELKFFLACIFMLFLAPGNAQVLVITKDYNACLYGLTDSPGHWVLPPKYLDIRPFEFGFAVVREGNKFGLVNSKGVIILPLIYDELTGFCNIISTYFLYPNTRDISTKVYPEPNQKPYYRARINSLVGVIDTAGKEIVPIRNYYLSDYLKNGISVLSSPEGKGFLDLNGVRGIMPKEFSSVIYKDLFLNEGLYIVSKTVKTDKYLKIKYGVFNDSARMVVPCEYDSINFFAGFRDIIEVYKNGKTGYYRKDGKKLFDAIYTVPRAMERKASPLVSDGFTFAFDGKYWGVLKFDGTFMMDFKYDELIAIPESYGYKADSLSPAWKIKEEGKWGILNKKKEWILPPTYTFIYDGHWKIEGEPDEYIFNVKMADHWGAISSTGMIEMPFIYDTVFAVLGGYVFWSEAQTDFISLKTKVAELVIYDYDPEKEALEKKKEEEKNRAENKNVIEEKPAHIPDQFELYYSYYRNPNENNKHYKFGKYMQGSSQLYVSNLSKEKTELKDYFFYKYKISDADKLANENYDPEMGSPYNSYEFGFSILIHKIEKDKAVNCNLAPLKGDSVFGYYTFDNDHTGIIRDDGKLILKPGLITNISLFEEEYFIGTDLEGAQKGMVDTDGKFVVDTLWTEIVPLTPGVVWVETKEKECIAPWNIFFIKTGKTLWQKEDQLVYYARHTVDVSATGTGIGIFNKETMSFVLPPVYKQISQSVYPSGNFIVQTCSGKFGIVNKSGAWQTDSCWRNILRIETTFTHGWWESSPPPEEKYMLLNDTAWIIYDQQGRSQKGDSSLMQQLLSVALDQYHYITSNSEKRCYDCPAIEGKILPRFDQWQTILLFNSLYRSSTAIEYYGKLYGTNASCSCGASKHEEITPDRPAFYNIQHAINFQTDSCLSFRKSIMSQNIPVVTNYYNYFLFADGPRIFTLDSLFTGEEWKKIITAETLNFLNANPGIDADCSNPLMYSKIFNESFLIGADGIALYYDWRVKTGGKQRISFLIPWSNLQQYLKPGLAHKLNLK